MPKQTYKINRFEGGLNRQSDPRDINDNELSMAWGINVDDVGVLKLGGGMGIPNHGPTTYGLDSSNVPVNSIHRNMAGYGLTHFSSDFKLGYPPNQRVESDFTVLAKSNSNINIIQYSADGEGDLQLFANQVNLGSGINPQIQYYVADGGLRCYDSDFTNEGNTNKSLMYINRDMFKNTVAFDGVNFVKLSTEPTYNEDFRVGQWSGYGPGGVDSTLIPEPNSAEGDKYLVKGGDAGDSFGDMYPSGTYSIINYGPGLGHKVRITIQNSTDALTDVTFKANWNIWISWLYDGAQETSPYPIRNNSDASVIKLYNLQSIAYNQILNLEWYWNGGPSDGWVPFDDLLQDDISIHSSWNDRITGFRLYMTSAGDQALNTTMGELYLIHEVDFIEGVQRSPTLQADKQDSTLTVYRSSLSNPHYFHYISSITMEQFPGETFASLNGYKHTDDLYAKWKTAVVMNRRTYIGNVATTYADGGIKNVFDDRMIKSPVNKFDTFPEGNNVDVAINDGDAIVALEGFADRILQFKKRHMYIINVSQDFEFLEAEHNMMGIKHPCQVCHTPHGVAWINDRGCHFYDGKGIKNLIDGKISPGRPMQFEDGDGILDDGNGDKRLTQSPLDSAWDDEGLVSFDDGSPQTVYNKYKGWAAFMNSQLEYIQDSGNGFQKGSLPSIGYDEQSQKLIIIKSLNDKGYDSSTNWVYSYDFKTNSWILNPWAYYMSNSGDSKTNFSNNSRGELILYSSWDDFNANVDPHGAVSETVGFYKWTDDSTTRKISSLRSGGANYYVHPVMFMTKDVDFGDAAVRKKVYKIYLTYRSSGDTNMMLRYGVDGEKGVSVNSGKYRKLPKGFANNSENNYTSGLLQSTNGEWKTISLKPNTSSLANNIKSFRLQLYNNSQGIPQPNDFAINDIAMVYRVKNVN